jgi:hypothetical protein
MKVSRLRLAAPAAALAILSLGPTGCGLISGSVSGGSGGGNAPADDSADKSRARVQAYLDAMKAKDVAAGRTQLCTPMQAAFDQAATGPNGDFASHFKVSDASITDVRANDGTQEVSTSVTVSASGRTAPTNLLFTVAKSGGEWCIAKEAAGTNATASADPGDDSSGDSSGG